MTAETVTVVARRPVRLHDGQVLGIGDRAAIPRDQAVLHALHNEVVCGEETPPPWWPRVANVDAIEATLRSQRREARAAALPGPRP